MEEDLPRPQVGIYSHNIVDGSHFYAQYQWVS